MLVALAHLSKSRTVRHPASLQHARKITEIDSHLRVDDILDARGMDPLVQEICSV
jgi:hypothetical protein